MNIDLWERVLWYASYKKYYIPEIPLSDKILYKKVAEKFIINKFLETWIQHNQDDPIDILDGMLIKYSIWERSAIEKNDNELIKVYDIYTKTLTGIKNFILKEIS